MKDVNIEHGNYCFSGLAVVKHPKEVFIQANKSRTFFGISDEETEAILSEVYDNAVIAIEAANKPAELPQIESEIKVEEPEAQQTDGKEKGVTGTSAGKKFNKKQKG